VVHERLFRRRQAVSPPRIDVKVKVSVFSGMIERLSKDGSEHPVMDAKVMADARPHRMDE